jgi:hypothetical protein
VLTPQQFGSLANLLQATFKRQEIFSRRSCRRSKPVGALLHRLTERVDLFESKQGVEMLIPIRWGVLQDFPNNVLLKKSRRHEQPSEPAGLVPSGS